MPRWPPWYRSRLGPETTRAPHPSSPQHRLEKRTRGAPEFAPKAQLHGAGVSQRHAFLSVSDGWAHWLGASTDNLVNQPWIEALPEQLRGDFQGLVTRAQLRDGVEAQVVYNQLPRILRVEPATHAGRECLMATLTAPSTKAAVGVNDRGIRWRNPAHH